MAKTKTEKKPSSSKPKPTAKAAKAVAKPVAAKKAVPAKAVAHPVSAKAPSRPHNHQTNMLAPKKAVVIKDPFMKRQQERLLHLRDGMLDSMTGVARDTLRSRAEGSEASAFGM